MKCSLQKVKNSVVELMNEKKYFFLTSFLLFKLQKITGLYEWNVKIYKQK